MKRTPSKRVKQFVQPNGDVQPIVEEAEEGPCIRRWQHIKNVLLLKPIYAWGGAGSASLSY